MVVYFSGQPRVMRLCQTKQKTNTSGAWWWHTPLVPALRRQRQENLCEFEASLAYKASSRTARTTQKNPVSKTNKQNKTKQKQRTTDQKPMIKTTNNQLMSRLYVSQFQHLGGRGRRISGSLRPARVT